MARTERSLLISCLGAETGGGLFAFDGKTVEQIDTLSTTGLTLADGRLGRLLWSSGEAGSVGELLIYDEAGVERYLRTEALPPGAERICRFTLRAPDERGEYGLTITTVQEQVAWFDELDERNAWSGHVRIL